MYVNYSNMYISSELDESTYFKDEATLIKSQWLGNDGMAN